MKPKLTIEIITICLIIFAVTYILPVHFKDLFVAENQSYRILGLPVGLALIAGFLLRLRFMRWLLQFLFTVITLGLIISLFTVAGNQPGFYVVIALNIILLYILYFSTDIKYFLSRKPKK